MILIGGIIIILWGGVGGFDWVGDMINCIQWIDPKIITLTKEEVINIIINKGGGDIEIEEEIYYKNKDLFDQVQEEYNNMLEEIKKTSKQIKNDI